MKLIYFLNLFLVLSCSTQITNEGQKVQLVTTNQKEKYCEMIDIVTTSNDVGWNAAHDRENAMNEARNKVASLGGNAMIIISSSTENAGYAISGNMLIGSSEGVVQVEALRCDIPKK